MVNRNRVIQELPDAFAPYAALSNVMSVITRKRERGLQSPLDAKALATISVPPGNASRTLQALRFLDLINDDGSSTECFERLCRAGDTGGQYSELLGQIIRDAYQRVFAIVDPARDSEIAIGDAFRQFEPQGQRPRMIAFFLGMCEQAGITERKVRTRKRETRRPTKTTSQQLTKPQAIQTQKMPLDSGSELQPKIAHPPQSEEVKYRLIFAVIQQLPPQRKWTATRRQKWLHAVEAAVDLVVDVVDEEQSALNIEEAQ